MIQDNHTPEKAAGKLHDDALQAEKHLESLATGLGQAGADSGVVKAVTQMAEAMRKIAGGLARAAGPEQPPAQPHTMDSATDAMMADRAAARQAPPQ